MIDIKQVFFLWFKNFLIISLNVVVLIMKFNKMDNSLKNYTNQLLDNLKNKKFIHHLKTISGVLI